MQNQPLAWWHDPDLDLHQGKMRKPDTDLFRRNGVPHIKNFNSTHGVELKSPCSRMELSKKDRNSQFPKRFLLQCHKKSCQNCDYICSPEVKICVWFLADIFEYWSCLFFHDFPVLWIQIWIPVGSASLCRIRIRIHFKQIIQHLVWSMDQIYIKTPNPINVGFSSKFTSKVLGGSAKLGKVTSLING